MSSPIPLQPSIDPYAGPSQIAPIGTIGTNAQSISIGLENGGFTVIAQTATQGLLSLQVGDSAHTFVQLPRTFVHAGGAGRSSGLENRMIVTMSVDGQ
jgi:hypothetical protein